MANRADLQTELEELLGSRNVYCDPPESVKMKYPAIRYSRSKIVNTFANNSVYRQKKRYDVVVIYDDPDSDLPDRVACLPMCAHDNHYVADNLHHDTYTLYR